MKATVQKVIPKGKHGPFAIATSEYLKGSITFSLEPTVWLEKDWPEEGAIVLLTQLRKKRLGWRAKQGWHWMLSNEQTEYKEIAMKNLKTFVEGLRKKFFPSEEDKAWKQWVDYKDRESRDLIKLLSSDVRESFKKRALFLLVVPDADFNTLYWKKEIGKFYHKIDFLKSLSMEFLDYVTELIVEFTIILSPTHNPKPKGVIEGGGGITVFMSIPDKYHDALYFYNHCILYLMTVLPEEKAEKVFPLCSLIDISTYWNMDEASGYNPFSHLLHMDIDEKWKKMADDRMRKIISDEISGKTNPREDWENALIQYAEIIQMQLYGKIKYSLELFAGQLQFLMDNRQGKFNLINWHVIKMLNLLSGDEYKKLRHTIARYVLLEDVGEFSKFSIYSKETKQAADYILDEFGDDQELTDRIQVLYEECAKKKAEEAAYQAEKKATEDDILAQMR